MSTTTAATSPVVRLVAVMGGGFMGGLLRYLGLRLGTSHQWTAGFDGKAIGLFELLDIKLLVINTFGVFVATRLLLGSMGQRHPDSPVRLFWTTGVLGGLTTYSSLIADLGQTWSQSAAEALVSGAISLGAAGAAVAIAVALNRRDR